MGKKTAYQYKTKGVCSRLITLELDGETIQNVEFIGGCSGNSRGISQLVKGRNAKEIIRRLRGVRCGTGRTSCPDQLSFALEEALKQAQECK